MMEATRSSNHLLLLHLALLLLLLCGAAAAGQDERRCKKLERKAQPKVRAWLTFKRMSCDDFCWSTRKSACAEACDSSGSCDCNEGPRSAAECERPLGSKICFCSTDQVPVRPKPPSRKKGNPNWTKEAAGSMHESFADFLSEHMMEKTSWHRRCRRLAQLPASESEFHALVRSVGEPVVFVNASSLFGSDVAKWADPAHLLRRMGGQTVRASICKEGEPCGNEPSPKDGILYVPQREMMSIEEVMDFKQEGEIAFVEQSDFFIAKQEDKRNGQPPRWRTWEEYKKWKSNFKSGETQERNNPLLGEWQRPAFLESMWPKGINLWFGVLPTTRTKISGTHNDNLDNLMLLLRGQKEFLMYSALDAANVYPRTWTSAQKHADPQDGPENGDHSFGNFIPIDPSSPDVDEYPRARKARPIRCVVNEGEALYIPAFTYHKVLSKGHPKGAPRGTEEKEAARGLNLGVNVFFEGDSRFHELMKSVLGFFRSGNVVHKKGEQKK